MNASPATTARRHKKASGPVTPTDWQTKYIALVRRYGNFHQTARMIGVNPSTAWRAREADPAFDALCLEARQEFADSLETQMVDDSHLTGNPAGQIVRLKALRPAEYIEKHAMLTLSVNVNELPVADATQLLRDMLGSTTPTTQQMLKA